MNYRKIYQSLIDKAKSRNIEGYYEKHHIVPRCMRGSDESENIAKLTPEEHYVAHQLLTKIYPNNDSLIKAAVMMIPNRPSNKLYGWLKRKFSDAQSKAQLGVKNSQYGTKWIHNPKTGESKKAIGDIEEGWVLGRFKNSNTDKFCVHCNTAFTPINLEIFCSDKCKIYHKSPAIKIIDNSVDEMIEIFKANTSITKTLNKFGIEGRAGNSYFSNILKENGLSVLKRRNTQ